MAGHSQFSNIKHRKEAQDAKRAKKFTKLRHEVIVAARSGLPDPELNPRLRTAISAARREGLPKDKIDNAIKSSTGANKDEDYQEVRYEGYGVNNSALIIEVLTNNRNRTAAELRFIFSRYGGNLGDVNYLFDHIGMIIYNNTNEQLFDSALEEGATDIIEENGCYKVICDFKGFAVLRDALYKEYGEPEDAKVMWQAKDLLPLSAESQEKVHKLIEALEDNDDVQHVYHNT